MLSLPIADSAKIESAGSELGDPFEVSAEKEITEADSSVSESNGADSEVPQEPETAENGGETTFSYDRLKAKSTNPVRGIDYKQREAYLSETEFQKVLGISPKKHFIDNLNGNRTCRKERWISSKLSRPGAMDLIQLNDVFALCAIFPLQFFGSSWICSHVGSGLALVFLLMSNICLLG